jgi:3-oxoacyl-(acyl-carrier-protein) synthase
MPGNGEGIVVAGAGMVSAAGSSIPEAMEALYSGATSAPVSPPLPTTVTPAPPSFVVRSPLPPDEDLTRTSRLALAALEQALASFDPASLDPPRLGVCMGTTVGCTFNGEAFWRSYRLGEDPGIAHIDKYLRNDLSSLIARRTGAAGPVMTVVNACASGTDAIGLGAEWIASGDCDAVIAGGADELERFAYHGFLSLKNVSLAPCRPFDRGRDGLNLGEGAGIVILRREREAGQVLGRILGYASASDAHHPTSPHPEGRGLRQAIVIALDKAGLSPSDVDLINAHGTATVENDRIEGRVLADLLSPDLPLVSTKGATGHTLGAAGAIEAIVALRNLADGRVPPSAGFVEPDPECRVVPTTRLVETDASVALSTSLAFGGTNSVLVLGGA